MNQAELIEAFQDEIPGVSKTEIKSFLDFQGHIIQKALASGDEVTLPGLGKLTVKSKAARTGRNPRTGEAVEIPAKKAPHFSAAKALKDALQEVPSGRAVA